MYISHTDSAKVVVLSQADDLGRERLVYYLIQVMNIVKKNCLVV